ncbi:hypothetical protein [Streptomyces sp. KR80]|uniref:hypothetical protein n=1 Tax=Streptomyces sp. KR80 TaxID=3457426 RepID=UPI003FD362AB
MRKLTKAALVAATAGSVGFIGAGTAVADGPHGHGVKVRQAVSCRSHDTNVSVLDISLANALLASGLIGNEGGAGNTDQSEGSVQTCTAQAL